MKYYKRLVYPYVAWISVMVVAPMLLIMFYAFSKDGNAVLDFVLTFDNFKKFFSDSIFIDVLWRSLKIAVATTVICIAVGYPAGYFISKCADGVKMRWILVITFPTWINMMVRTYAWRGILQDEGVLNKFFGIFGIGPVPMLDTGFAVVLGMVYNFLPFMIIQIYTSLAKLDNSLLEAAADLGANKAKSFLRITLPLSIPGVLSGITLVFLPAVSSFYIPEMLGGGRYYMVGNLIETQFLTTENWNFGSAVSLIMVIIIIVSMYFTKKADKTEIMDQRGK